MKKLILLSVFIFFSQFSNSQSKTSKLISEINQNFNTFSVKEKQVQIFLNRKEWILDINDYQIPLNEVKIKYYSDPRTVNGLKREGLLVFECNSDCIGYKDSYVLSIGFAFKNKKSAYETIDLINNLILELENSK